MGDTKAQQIALLGVWGNSRRAVTTTYTVAGLDKGWTIACGGGASYTVALNAASGYDSDFQVVILNEDSANDKTIAANGLSSFSLHPQQAALLFNQNGNWIASLLAKASGGLTRITFSSRDMTAASGNVSYTGIGFKPSNILFAGIGGAGVQSFFVGFDLGSSPRAYTQIAGASGWFTTGGASIYLSNPTSADTQTAAVLSMDPDGFTLTWTKAGTPTGTGFFSALCFQ